MKVDSAEFKDNRLCLEVTYREAVRWLYGFKPGEYDIKKTVKHRSLNANAYAWSLIGQIANKIGIKPEEVYRHCIENIGGQTSTLTISKNALHAFRRAFVGEHIGRNVKVIGEDEFTYDVLVTYGSSDYDTRQMSQLIDSIVQECKDLEIPTKDDEYINELIKEWERTHGE